MNLARFRFSILRCTYLEEPFQHVHLLPTLREVTFQSDRKQTRSELGITFPCAALCYSHAKLSGSRQAERMDSNHQDLVYDQAVPSYLHFPHNPDSRVSKVFYVSCLPRVDSDKLLPLQGGDCHSPKMAMMCAGNCIRFSTSCITGHFIRASLHFLLRTHIKERSKCMKSIVKHFCLRIFLMNTVYYILLKRSWDMFSTADSA